MSESPMKAPVTRGELIAWVVICWLSLMSGMVVESCGTDDLRERLDRLALSPCLRCLEPVPQTGTR